MRKYYKFIILFILISTFTIVFFHFSFLFDNKYSTKGPYGQAGTLRLTQDSLNRTLPLYLIDGWMFYDGSYTPDTLTDSTPYKVTYIGEYSNYQRGNPSKSPLGNGTYRLKLYYDGAPFMACLDFPELCSDYIIWINGQQITSGTGNARASFVLNAGETELLLNISNQQGYYSGMYFPGCLGTESTITHVSQIKTFFYCIALLCPITLALYSLIIWNDKKHLIFRYFGLLSIFFSLYISYYFVHLFSLPCQQFWYLVEDLAFYGMLYCMIKITSLSGKTTDCRYDKIMAFVIIIFPLTSLILYFMIPYISWSVTLHGILQNIYRIILFLWLTFCALRSFQQKNFEYQYIFLANLVFGIGILNNLISSNLFEPIYTFWQFEWCGLILVLIFGGMMVSQNRRVLRENAAFTLHLSEMVEERTVQLTSLLEERRQFFSNMAHDLKAPLSATKSFIEMIKQHSVGIDKELRYYIQQVEHKQKEMSKRIQSLNELNKIDKIQDSKEVILISEFLDDIYDLYNPEAEVLAIHFTIIPLATNCSIFMQREKLSILFENIIFNALSVTPQEGSITITGKTVENTLVISIADTGCGISEDKLPYLFNRFYVGRDNPSEGSGLGLYIVKTIIMEIGGTVDVTSSLTTGTTFHLSFPLYIK